MNRAQPDKETALSFTTGQFAVGSNYNETARDLLLKIPGVNFKNHRLIMDNVANLKELSTLDVETLAKIIDSKIAAKQIVDFMNFNVSQQ
ncbi:hypothetical protein GJ496_006953 [Pomphorhynchus laevis]|nr:hypothetical protein GJ496_006953 [Pomphorhynchus laevis]